MADLYNMKVLISLKENKGANLSVRSIFLALQGCGHGNTHLTYRQTEGQTHK